jgi:hypothetical protein
MSGLRRGGLAVGELAAECLEADVDQVADVADAVSTDPADLLVGKAVLELQADHVALAGRECVEQADRLRGRLASFHEFIRSRVVAGANPGMIVTELGHAALLPQDVERPVAADGEEPLREARLDGTAILGAEAEERILDHVTRRVGIAEHPRCKQRQRTFESIQRRPDPVAVGGVGITHQVAREETGPIHSGKRAGAWFLSGVAEEFLRNRWTPGRMMEGSITFPASRSAIAMEKVVRVFRSFEEAARAEKEYYQSLTGEQRLRILIELNHYWAKSYGDQARQGLQRIYRVIKFSTTDSEA